MSKIFSVNFNKSHNDKYGATATLGATAKVRKDEKGLVLQGNSTNTDIITYGNIASINEIGTGEFSFVVGANTKGFKNVGSIYNALAGKGAVGTNGFIIYYANNTSIGMAVHTSLATATINHQNKNNLYIITRNAAGLCTFYVNGIPLATVTQSTTIATTSALSIGCDSVTTRVPAASIYLTEVYNHCLSDTEIQKLTADFQSETPVAKPKRGFVYPKATDLSNQKGTAPTQGLTAAYNMIQTGNTLVDISGNGKNATAVGNVTSTKDGVKFNNGYYNTNNFYPSLVGSVSFRFKHINNATTQYLFGTKDANNRMYMSIVTNQLTLILGSSSSATLSTALVSGNTYTATVTYSGNGQTASLYLDGVLVITGTQTGDVNQQTYPALIGALNNSGSIVSGSIVTLLDIRFYDRAITLAEHKDYHNSFAKQVVLNDCFCDSSADNLAIVPREWIATSGTYKVTEILISNTVIFSANFDTNITGWNAIGGYTATWNNGSADVVASGAYTGGSIEFQLASGFGIALGKRYRITAVVKSVSGNTSFKSQVDSILGNTTSITTEWTNVVYEGTSIATGLRQFRCGLNGAGEFLLDSVKVEEIPALATLPSGARYLECVTAGTIAIPSDTAYGTWEFDVYKGSDTTTPFFQFIAPLYTFASASSVGGYDFRLNATESISLIKTTAAGMTTANAYITHSTWYRIKITRTNTGTFTLYIKGGIFVPTAGQDGWTLVIIPGGSGTNPITDATYTTSNYFTMDLDAGDRFGNLVIRDGVVV